MPFFKHVIAALFVVITVAGCGGNEATSTVDGNETQQRAELMGRPSLEEADGKYQEMLSRMRDEVTASIPSIQWQPTNKVTRAACSEFTAYRDEAETHNYRGSQMTSALPDTDWARVKEIVERVAGEYGFSPSKVRADSPGHHDLIAFDQDGATYKAVAAPVLVLSGSSACHLPQAAKDRITATGK